jgi:hypothetical protein
MSRTTKVLGFSVPPTLVAEMEKLAREEGRTKSELFREMFRVYRCYKTQRDQDEHRWVMEIIRRAKAEPMREEERDREDKRLLVFGAAQSKKLGIKAKDINRIIHENRLRHRA